MWIAARDLCGKDGGNRMRPETLGRLSEGFPEVNVSELAKG